MAERRAWVWPASIAVVAFCVRLLALGLLHHADRLWPRYLELARGGWLPRAPWGESPVVLYALALLDPLGVQGILVVQALLSTASCLLLWRAGSRLFGPVAGRAAGFAWALFGAAIAHDLQPGPGPYVVFCGLVALEAGLVARRVRGWLLCGAGLGLAASIQAELWLVLPVVLLRRRDGATRVGLVLGALLAPALVAATQAAGCGEWIPGRGGWSYALYQRISFDAELYDRPEPAATSELAPRVRNRTERAIDLARYLQRDPTLDAAGAERYWRGWLRQTLGQRRPWRLVAGRLALALHQHAGETSGALLHARERLARWPLVSFALLALLGAAGWAARGREAGWLVALVGLGALRLAAGGVLGGDRLVTAAALCLLAGAGVAAFLERPLRGRLRLAADALAVGLLVCYPWPAVREGRNAARQIELRLAARDELRDGRPRHARRLLERAVALDPWGAQWEPLYRLLAQASAAEGLRESAARYEALAAGRLDARALATLREQAQRGGWEHRRILGRLLSERGEHEEALRLWRELLRERPDHPEPPYQAGRALLPPDEPLLRRARDLGLDLTPLGPTLDHALAQALLAQGRRGEALPLLERSVARNGRWAESWRALARLRTELGDAPGAVAAWRRVLELLPADREARRALGR